ncbi:MAG: secondary thiamine-phosphate synthase enzyme YjbQ [Deltaproteobacteria bacterium]
MDSVRLSTSRRSELIDITGQVQAAVTKAKAENGLCVVFCPHTTAGLTINENADPAVRKDIITALNDLVPENADYSHAEGNSDSHIKSSLFGPSLTVIVEKGKLCLGTWQGIYFCESDGPRQREVWIKVTADA